VALIVYLDETRNHSLELIDKDFPIFALVMLICDFGERGNETKFLIC